MIFQTWFKPSSRMNRSRVGLSDPGVSLSTSINPVRTKEDLPGYTEGFESGEMKSEGHVRASSVSPGIEDRLGSTEVSPHKKRAQLLPADLFLAHIYPFLGEDGLRKAGEVCNDWQFECIWKKLNIVRWNEARRTPILDDPWIDIHPELRKPENLNHGLRDIVERMPVERLKKDLRRLAPRPEPIIKSFLEKSDLVREVMGWMLLTRKGLRCHGSNLPDNLPAWAKSIPDWRWSYLYVKLDGRRRWCTEEDIMRREWTMEHGVGHMTKEDGSCIFHSDGRYTSTGSLVKGPARWEIIENHPLTLQVTAFHHALEAEHDGTDWRLHSILGTWRPLRLPPP